MAFSLEQMAGGTTSLTPPTAEYKWRATGEPDDATVMALIRSGTPGFVSTAGGMVYRQDIKLEHKGRDLFYAMIPYGLGQQETDTTHVTFSTTGGTVHISASKETVGMFPAGAPDNKQLIGVNGEEVQGTDVIIPALKLTVKHRYAIGSATIQFAKHLARLTGKTNSAPFLTFDVGEVLYLGAEGEVNPAAEVEITHQFACEENIADMVIGAINGIRKKGWEYAWIRYQDAVDGGRPVQQPQFVYVEQVYTPANLRAALGFG
jgi:hypothetical protein